jgi:hypothetical protein
MPPRFGVAIEDSPRNFLRNLKADDVKTFFDWLEDAHYRKTKADGSLSNHWRALKRQYMRETGLPLTRA